MIKETLQLYAVEKIQTSYKNVHNVLLNAFALASEVGNVKLFFCLNGENIFEQSNLAGKKFNYVMLEDGQPCADNTLPVPCVIYLQGKVSGAAHCVIVREANVIHSVLSTPE